MKWNLIIAAVTCLVTGCSESVRREPIQPDDILSQEFRTIFRAQGYTNGPDKKPSKHIQATNTQDVVEGFIKTIGTMEERFPELHGFTQEARDRKDNSHVFFERGAKRAEGKEFRISENGITLSFSIFPDNLQRQLSGSGYSRHLTNLHVIVYGFFSLSDTPSEGLRDSLDEIMREHVRMVEELDTKAAHKASEPSVAPGPQVQH
jgi:hypothetical protein